ncbi:MAG: hypothetical protein SPL19_05605 [Fibrobacter sp.]|nr:hypothetical protein [Fibrobacter sp.]MDY6368652.1 hypothetical protein [Fibrobacter sp.]MDY6389816.1 hypothetical protein [Fibrobacter sp.]
MNLLLVEDKPDNVKEIKYHYVDKGWTVEIADFKNALNYIEEKKPDIIVMDWKDDLDDDLQAGEPIFEKANDKPIIVFSALAAAITLNEEQCINPFIEKILKGDENEVIKKIDEWEKYLNLVSEVKNQINAATTIMMASLKPVIKLDNDYPGDAVVKFMLNKQASEFFNSRLTEESNNPTWTQYLYPSSARTLLVADILKSKAEEKFFVVLTPSCDMARVKKNGDTNILVAECENEKSFHSYVKPKDGASAEKIKEHKEHVDKVSMMLSYGYNKGKVSLPELPKIFPYLTINLKKLSFIKLSEISLSPLLTENEKFNYCRIASVNSPYREQIVWAHMVNSCRPGVPDRDYSSWAAAIIK